MSAAQAAGASERRLRHPDLHAPFHGARIRSDAIRAVHEQAEEALDRDESPTAVAAALSRRALLLRMDAYASIAQPHVFFSHVSAALIWKVPLPLRVLAPEAAGRIAEKRAPELDANQPTRPLDVAVFPPHVAPRAAGVHGRQLSPTLHTMRTHAGMRVASPASMWAELASELTVDELIAVGDALVREPRLRNGRRGPAGSGLTTIAQLETSTTAGRRHGAARLREALLQIRVGSASKAETDFRLALVRSPLPEPTLDLDVRDAKGGFIGCTELAYPDYHLLIEHEGDHHRTDRAQWNRDIEKHALCAAAGWTVLRTTASHLYPDPGRAVALVRDALIRAGWRG